LAQFLNCSTNFKQCSSKTLLSQTLKTSSAPVAEELEIVQAQSLSANNLPSSVYLDSIIAIRFQVVDGQKLVFVQYSSTSKG
jgi:hypothetical protein